MIKKIIFYLSFLCTINTIMSSKKSIILFCDDANKVDRNTLNQNDVENLK